MKDLRYGVETIYIGRNGAGKQSGLATTYTGNTVRLEPINSKGMIANCVINIPFDDIPKVIEILKSYTK